MKKIFKYMFAGLIACGTMTSCQDALETTPTSSTSGDKLMSNTTSALVPLNGIYRSFYEMWAASGAYDSFGINSYSLMADAMGDDFIIAKPGSGWFFFDHIYEVKSFFTVPVFRPYDIWNAHYTWIANANYILAAENTIQGLPTDINYIMGQAYAIRGYAYFMLAQNYARTYKGHEGEPCCPIYTEPTVPGTQGKARSTVAHVYEQVVSDLDKALTLLKGTKPKHITHMGYAVASGIRARVALVMEDWATAQTAALEAIETSGAEVLAPKDFLGLNNVEAANVMWGAKVTPDQVSGSGKGCIFAHLDLEGSFGKAYKQINKILYDTMDPDDARTAWWDPTFAGNKNGGYQQMKFKFSNPTTKEGDYIWMRVEEMYLTAAEAACRLGDEAKAKELLKAVMSLRVANYECTKTGTALGKLTYDFTGSLLEEILLQRRIELWGEYGRVYDIRRLKQGFRRTSEMGFSRMATLDGRPTDNPENYMWVITIPQSEFDGNVNMDAEKDQNPMGDE